MLDIAHLSTREKVSLQEFIDRILHKFKDKIVLIRLYGSKARGDFYKESDIDLLIVLKEKDKAVEDLIVEAEWEIMDKHDSYICSVVFDLNEYNRLNNLQTNFMLNVAEEGINLYGNQTQP